MTFRGGRSGNWGEPQSGCLGNRGEFRRRDSRNSGSVPVPGRSFETQRPQSNLRILR